MCRSWLKGFIRSIWIEPGCGTIDYVIPLPAGNQVPGRPIPSDASSSRMISVLPPATPPQRRG